MSIVCKCMFINDVYKIYDHLVTHILIITLKAIHTGCLNTQKQTLLIQY